MKKILVLVFIIAISLVFNSCAITRSSSYEVNRLEIINILKSQGVKNPEECVTKNFVKYLWRIRNKSIKSSSFQCNGYVYRFGLDNGTYHVKYYGKDKIK